MTRSSIFAASIIIQASFLLAITADVSYATGESDECTPVMRDTAPGASNSNSFDDEFGVDQPARRSSSNDFSRDRSNDYFDVGSGAGNSQDPDLPF
jgi:hypothetical protein